MHAHAAIVPATVDKAPTKNAKSNDPASLTTRLMSESNRNNGTARGTRCLLIRLYAGDLNGIIPTFARSKEHSIVTSGADNALPNVV